MRHELFSRWGQIKMDGSQLITCVIRWKMQLIYLKQKQTTSWLVSLCLIMLQVIKNEHLMHYQQEKCWKIPIKDGQAWREDPECQMGGTWMDQIRSHKIFISQMITLNFLVGLKAWRTSSVNVVFGQTKEIKGSMWWLQMCFWPYKLLHLPSFVLPARLLFAKVPSQGIHHIKRSYLWLLPQISLQTQLHWAILGCSQVLLLIFPKDFGYWCNGNKCCWLPWWGTLASN